MKKLILIIALVISCSLSAQVRVYGKPNNYNLNNGDVRHTLIQAAQSEGWELISAYKKIKNARNPKEGWSWVLVFEKDGKFRKYEGK